MNKYDVQIVDVVDHLLGHLGLYKKKKDVFYDLMCHPRFPSILSIVDTLKLWGISSDAYYFQVDKDLDGELPGIARLKTDDFVAIHSIKNNCVTYWHPKHGTCIHGADKFEFLREVILVDKCDVSRIKPIGSLGNVLDYKFISVYAVLALLAPFVLVSGYFTKYWLAFLLVLLTEIVLSLILYLSQFSDRGSPGYLCPTNRFFDCSSVINSPAGELFGKPMSEWGIIIFGGCLLTVFIASILKVLPDIIPWLMLEHLLILLYCMYLILYQSVVIKKWCILCCIVHGLIASNLFLLVSILQHQQRSDRFFIAKVSISMVAGVCYSFIVWSMYKKIINMLHDNRQNKIELLRVRRDPTYIESLISSEVPLRIDRFHRELIWGDPIAPRTITIVIGLGCRYCRNLVEALDKLVMSEFKNYKIFVRFIGQEDGSRITLNDSVVLRLIEISMHNGGAQAMQALMDYYSMQTNVKNKYLYTWLEKYNLNYADISREAHALYKQHNKWRNDMGIVEVPTVLIDGVALPKNIPQIDAIYYILKKDREIIGG